MSLHCAPGPYIYPSCPSKIFIPPVTLKAGKVLAGYLRYSKSMVHRIGTGKTLLKKREKDLL